MLKFNNVEKLKTMWKLLKCLPQATVQKGKIAQGDLANLHSEYYNLVTTIEKKKKRE